MVSDGVGVQMTALNTLWVVELCDIENQWSTHLQKKVLNKNEART